MRRCPAAKAAGNNNEAPCGGWDGGELAAGVLLVGGMNRHEYANAAAPRSNTRRGWGSRVGGSRAGVGRRGGRPIANTRMRLTAHANKRMSSSSGVRDGAMRKRLPQGSGSESEIPHCVRDDKGEVGMTGGGGDAGVSRDVRGSGGRSERRRLPQGSGSELEIPHCVRDDKGAGGDDGGRWGCRGVSRRAGFGGPVGAAGRPRRLGGSWPARGGVRGCCGGCARGTRWRWSGRGARARRAAGGSRAAGGRAGCTGSGRRGGSRGRRRAGCRGGCRRR